MLDQEYTKLGIIITLELLFDFFGKGRTSVILC